MNPNETSNVDDANKATNSATGWNTPRTLHCDAAQVSAANIAATRNKNNNPPVATV